MRGRFRQRHAVAGELSQRDDWKIPTRRAHGARGSKADAAHACCRSAPGTTERKESRHSVRKIIASHCRSPRETRADDFVFEPARFLHFAAMQQLRRGAKLSELQCRAHVSPAARNRRTIELSFVRAHRRCSKKMSGVRTRRVDLSRLRH